MEVTRKEFQFIVIAIWISTGGLRDNINDTAIVADDPKPHCKVTGHVRRYPELASQDIRGVKASPLALRMLVKHSVPLPESGIKSDVQFGDQRKDSRTPVTS